VEREPCSCVVGRVGPAHEADAELQRRFVEHEPARVHPADGRERAARERGQRSAGEGAEVPVRDVPRERLVEDVEADDPVVVAEVAGDVGPRGGEPILQADRTGP
jgi:hypothetical protein